MSRFAMCVAGFTLAMVGTANAGLYVDVQDVDPDVLLYEGGPGYSGVFDLVTPGSDSFEGFTDSGGFNPDNETAVSGFLAFWLRDDNDFFELEKVQVELDGVFAAGSEGGNFGTLVIPDTTFDFLVSLNEDGQLSYLVTATNGDAYLEGAMCSIEAEAKATPEAPAVAVWAMIGGVFGLGCWLRRKRQIPA